MRHLEHVDRAGIDRHGLGLRIAGEQHREVAPARHQHQAEQVRVLVGVVEQLPGRPESGQAKSACVELPALREPVRLHAGGQGRASQPRVVTGIDESVRPHRREQRAKVARVIGLIVGDHDRVEAIDPELGEAILDAVVRRPRIDEHGLRIGRLQQDRVPLTDIEDPHDEVRRRGARGLPPEWPQDRQADRHRNDGGERGVLHRRKQTRSANPLGPAEQHLQDENEQRVRRGH